MKFLVSYLISEKTEKVHFPLILELLWTATGFISVLYLLGLELIIRIIVGTRVA